MQRKYCDLDIAVTHYYNCDLFPIFSDLYSAQRIQMATIQGQCARGRDIDQMMAEARDKLGNISFIVNSHNCLYKEFPRHLESLGDN